MRTRNRYFFLALLLVVALVPWSSLHAENAVRYTDAAAMPGGSFTVDVIMENDVVIAAAFIPFKWSSPDVELRSIEIFQDRFEGELIDTFAVIDQVERTSAIILLPKLSFNGLGYINRGSGVLARLSFDVSPLAETQTVYIDPNAIDAGQGTTVETHYSNFNGTQLIFPTVYSGQITIYKEIGPLMIVAEPHRFTFGGYELGLDPAPQDLTIRSSNGFPMNWEATWESSWLSVSPGSGSAPSYPVVSVSLEGIAAGEYADTIWIFAPDGDVQWFPIPVGLTVDETRIRLNVVPPVLQWTTTRDGPPQITQSLSVTSDARLPVDWTVVWDEPWISLLPASGATPGPVDIRLDVDGFATGTYTDSLQFIADDAVNSPVYVPIVVTIDSTRAGGGGIGALEQNHPNPFSLYREGRTRISYNLNEPGRVSISIHNVLGQTVRHLVTGRNTAAGDGMVEWDVMTVVVASVPSGHYFYRLTTPKGSVTRRMILIK